MKQLRRLWCDTPCGRLFNLYGYILKCCRHAGRCDFPNGGKPRLLPCELGCERVSDSSMPLGKIPGRPVDLTDCGRLEGAKNCPYRSGRSAFDNVSCPPDDPLGNCKRRIVLLLNLRFVITRIACLRCINRKARRV